MYVISSNILPMMYAIKPAHASLSMYIASPESLTINFLDFNLLILESIAPIKTNAT